MKRCQEGGFIFTVHFCNTAVFQRGNFPALVCILRTATPVGYNTITINKEYTLLTINFDDVNGEALTVQKAFPFCDGMTEAKVYGSADNIQVMNASGGYDTYFMWNGASGKSGTADPTKRGWAKAGSTSLTADTLPKGATMWYQSRGAKYEDSSTYYNLTVAGAVSLAEKYDYTLNKEYTLVGNPFPVEIPLNGGVVLTEPTVAKVYGSADNVQIMNEAGGYDTYFMWNGASGKSGTADPTKQGWQRLAVLRRRPTNSLSAAVRGSRPAILRLPRSFASSTQSDRLNNIYCPARCRVETTLLRVGRL